MAHATHLTIGTADRIRLDARRHGLGREDEDDGNEVRQEVQVSITYALDSGDTDLVRLAETKALEVQLAHEAVWNRIGAFSGNAQCSGGSDPAGSGSGHCTFRHDGEEEDESDDPDDDPLAGPPQTGGDPFSGGPSGARRYPVEPAGRDSPFPTASRVPLHTAHTIMGGVAAPNMHVTAEPDGDPVTGPQKILIRARAKKAGLTPYALEAMVFKQFRAWKVERLTKEQATALLDVLERDLKGMDPKQKEERQRLSHGNESGGAVTTGTA